jgi:dephospho-CoA kinase
MTTPLPPAPRPEPAPRGPVVVGLAGGIASGKSRVAQAFAKLGWAVVDSDAQVAAQLARPEIAQTLASWWGPGVLDAQGMVDRRAVGKIVFSDPAQRQRLEALLHPLIARTRQEVIRDAALATRQSGAAAPRGVVLDAPLLFEAGLDRECDAVVFVDASHADRLERVRRNRGWDAEELARREAAQWPLDKKRARCRFVVHNPAQRGSGQGPTPGSDQPGSNQPGVDERGVDEQVTRIVAILIDELPG